MAMDWQTSNKFDEIMRNGNWHVGKADYYEIQTYYSDAKSHYFEAMRYFKDAESLAARYDDYRKNDALSRYTYCEDKVREVSYKAFEPDGR